jgi:hypothetical protein
MSGKYPTKEELERMSSELSIKIRDNARNESAAAAMLLHPRLAQIQADVVLERGADE